MRPRSIVFDLFGDHLRYTGGRATTRAIVELLEVFEIGEPTVRTVLSRMRKEGWFDTERDGRQVLYALSGRSWRLLDDGRTRIFERAQQPWDGQWRMVLYSTEEQDRPGRERLRKALSWLGFGQLTTASWVSPHDRLAQVEQALAAESRLRTDLFTCRSRGRPADLDMVDRCWDLHALGRDYHEFVARLDELPPMGELAVMPGREALRLRIELVGAYRHFPFRDPDLPDELLPEGWPGAQAHRLFVDAHAALEAPAAGFVREVLDGHG